VAVEYVVCNNVPITGVFQAFQAGGFSFLVPDWARWRDYADGHSRLQPRRANRAWGFSRHCAF
jgi:hypothetical protein